MDNISWLSERIIYKYYNGSNMKDAYYSLKLSIKLVNHLLL